MEELAERRPFERHGRDAVSLQDAQDLDQADGLLQTTSSHGSLLFGPEPLQPRHLVSAFACGTPALDDHLKDRALADARAGRSHTQVACRTDTVVAYCSLAAGSVEAEAATERPVEGQGLQPVPVIVLARLAVDLAEQGRGLGGQMLVQALARCAAAADLIGVRAVLVQAKDAKARGFYERYGFEPSPTHPLHLLLLMKDVRRTLRARRSRRAHHRDGRSRAPCDPARGR